METERILFTKTFVAAGQGPDQNEAPLSVSDVCSALRTGSSNHASSGTTDPLQVLYDAIVADDAREASQTRIALPRSKGHFPSPMKPPTGRGQTP